MKLHELFQIDCAFGGTSRQIFQTYEEVKPMFSRLSLRKSFSSLIDLLPEENAYSL